MMRMMKNDSNNKEEQTDFDGTFQTLPDNYVGQRLKESWL